jgi:hypothetical protein
MIPNGSTIPASIAEFINVTGPVSPPDASDITLSVMVRAGHGTGIPLVPSVVYPDSHIRVTIMVRVQAILSSTKIRTPSIEKIPNVSDTAY